MLDPLKDIIRLVGLSDPALHALIGLAIYLLAAALLRRPLSSWKPWSVALGFQFINEIADLAKDVLDGDILHWRGGLLDTAVTMALPTMLVVFFRWRARQRPA